MANEVEVPIAKNLKEGLAHGVTATGRQLGIVGAKIHGLYKIQYIDGRPGSLPEKLQGRYTGIKYAQLDLDRFIKETWDFAEENTPKRSRKQTTAEAVA